MHLLSDKPVCNLLTSVALASYLEQEIPAKMNITKRQMIFNST